MKNLTTAFSMVWGNFTVLPCPYKRWDSKLNNLMLALLPLVGAVIGGLWLLLVEGMELVISGFHHSASMTHLISLAATFYIYAVCGFMHMDGFMDCNDAILSRRPLEDRQRILKDSTVGAFAVVTVVFLVLAFYVSMDSLLEQALRTCPRLLWGLFLLPVMSRGTAAMGVLVHRPIGHSQYNKSFGEQGKQKYIGMVLLLMVAAVLAAAYFAGPFWWVCLTDGALVLLAGCIAMERARRNLGGMSGDIAGYTICWSELAGVLGLAVLAGLSG